MPLFALSRAARCRSYITCTKLLRRHLGLDIRFVAADMLLELEQLGRKLDLGLEEVLRIQVVCRGVTAVLLNVQTDSRAGRAGTRQTNDDATARGEARVQTLVGGDGSIKVGVREVAGFGHGAFCIETSGQY